MSQKKDALEKATKKGGKKDKRRKSCDGKREQKEKKGKKGKRSQKKAKKGAALSALTCPCCSKHCPLSKPKCGKGKAIRAKMEKNI